MKGKPGVPFLSQKGIPATLEETQRFPYQSPAMANIRAFAVVGVNTLGSRVLGFVRDSVIAAALGTGFIADAWVVAFRMPNMFRSLFAEGAFNSSFVPLFSRRLEEDGREGALRFAEESLGALLLAVTAFTVVVEIFMPQFTHLIAPGFRADPDQFELTVTLSRIAFPYLVFMALVALQGGMLNALGHYAIPAFSPTLLNIVLVIMLYALKPFVPTVGHALAWGVIAAGIAQFVIIYWGLTRAGMVPALHRPRLTPNVRRLAVLAFPGVISSGITQVNILVGTMISTGQAGAAAVLYYADRVYQLPLGVIGIAVSVVLLPTLTRALRSGNEAGALESQNRSLEFTLFLTLPAAAAIATIPLPIVTVLFQHGHFLAADSARTAQSLVAFGLGLPAFVLIKGLTPGFFAREDTVSPLKFAALSIAVNVVTSLTLIFVFHFESRALAIAIATALASWLNTAMLGGTLARRGYLKPDRQLVTRLPRMVVASVLMGAALWATSAAIWAPYATTIPMQIALVAGLVLEGLVVYALASLALRTTTLKELARMMKRAG